MAKADGFKLINYYLKKYEKKFGGRPERFNRYALSHGFECMYEDYGLERGQEIIDYFIDTPDGRNPGTLVYTYGDINTVIENLADDEIKRAELRRQTIQQVKEARERRSEGASSRSS